MEHEEGGGGGPCDQVTRVIRYIYIQSVRLQWWLRLIAPGTWRAGTHKRRLFFLSNYFRTDPLNPLGHRHLEPFLFFLYSGRIKGAESLPIGLTFFVILTKKKTFELFQSKENAKNIISLPTNSTSGSSSGRNESVS